MVKSTARAYWGTLELATSGGSKIRRMSGSKTSNKMNTLDQLLVAKSTSFGRKRFLVQFENIPMMCTSVIWAKMHISFYVSAHAGWLTPSQAPSIVRPLQVYRVNSGWEESQVTSIKRTSSLNWNEPYLGSNGQVSIDANPNVLSTVTWFIGQTSSYMQFDVTVAASYWKMGGPNNGLLVMAANENVDGTDLRFYSRRHNVAGTTPFMTVLCSY